MVYGQNSPQLVIMHSERRGKLVKVPALRRTTARVCAQIEASMMTRGPLLLHLCLEAVEDLYCSIACHVA